MIRIRVRSPQRGYALITSIIFLVLLTIVAVTAFKSSGLEARMSANNTLHTQAFESSESIRTLTDVLVDANMFNRPNGWPSTIGGTVSSGFDADAAKLLSTASEPCPVSASNQTTLSGTGFVICQDPSTNKPRDWASGNSETGAFNPTKLDQDAWYSKAVDSKRTITGTVSVYELNTALAAGSGSQQVAGYLGLGRAAAAGGGNVFFFVDARGNDYASAPQAGAETSAIYRDLIRN